MMTVHLEMKLLIQNTGEVCCVWGDVQHLSSVERELFGLGPFLNPIEREIESYCLLNGLSESRSTGNRMGWVEIGSS